MAEGLYYVPEHTHRHCCGAVGSEQDLELLNFC